jgi:hypothetical protein
MTMHNHMLPAVRADYWNSSTGKFSSMLHTVSTLHQVTTTYFFTSTNFWPASLKSTQDTKDIVQNWLEGLPVTLTDEDLKSRSHYMICALIYMATMWRSALM